jgi:hypothetical protein
VTQGQGWRRESTTKAAKQQQQKKADEERSESHPASRTDAAGGGVMVGQSNRDRAYLMALGAWKTFGHSPEDPYAFARRIAAIGEAQGVAAAAEAVAEDCRTHGLEMSQGRVLKSLTHRLESNRDVLRRLASIEELRLEDLDRVPPGVAQLLATAERPPPRPPSKLLVWGVLAAAAVLVWWLFFS